MSTSGDLPGTRRVYTGRVINLDVDRVVLPNGTTADLEIIRHPGASAIVPILSDAEASDPTLVLIRQYRHAAAGYLYEIPAGRLNDGEDPAQCAVRELAEETGYRAGRVEHLFSMFTTPGFTDERIHVFLASGLSEGPTAHEADEILKVEQVPVSRALALIEGGEIQDAKTALSILYLARYSRHE
ncbi:MAG: NUDIX hydrolase [Gemmatimonadota bacterium]|nr:NUDIX hydrolase [Gemmatimonadota bacterium]MDE3172042.1 NUDIX hydrolase [Gemmatimonadota bacterium]